MNNIDVKIKKLHENAIIPFKANNDNGNACFDLTAVSITVKDKYIEYGLGFSTEFSEDWEAEIRPRSSISKYDLILSNAPGTIDSGYRGEWKARFKTTCENPEIYKVGDRIAQVKFNPVYKTTFVEAAELNNSSRNDGGFGSTNANV